MSQEKRRQITLSPFFFVCFLLDSGSILYCSKQRKETHHHEKTNIRTA